MREGYDHPHEPIICAPVYQAAFATSAATAYGRCRAIP